MAVEQELKTHKEIDRTEGRDEMNLAEFPLFFLGQRVPAGVKTLNYEHEVYDSSRNRTVKRRLEIVSSDKYGLPTVRDADVLLALMMIAKQTTDFESPAVSFNRYQLTDILGWDHSGTSYRRIETALKKWKTITLFFDDGWWDKEKKEWSEEAISLLDNYKITKVRRGKNQPELCQFECLFGKRFFSSLKSGNIKKLDLSEWFSLRIPAAKQMYRFLDKRFYFRKKLDFDLRVFAHDHIGFSRNYAPSKLKDKLQPAIDELVSIGFIDAMPIGERYVKVRHGEWRVLFKRAERKRLGGQPLTGKLSERPAARRLISELTAAGMTATTARSFVEDASYDDNLIREKLEMLAWYQERDPDEAPKSPGGWLAKAIRDDYQSPAGFETKEEREAKQKRVAELREKVDREKRESKDREERERQESDRRHRENLERVKQHLLSLNPTERDALIDAAMESTEGIIRKSAVAFRRNPEKGKGEMFYDMALLNHVLPLLEENSVQQTLFERTN